ncbi:MAG: NADPH-dependent FMN reductase [Halobacteriaceae archaeon]
MSDDVLVVGVCGSLADDSYTRTALRYALGAARDAGAETELVDLREYALPLYDPDNSSAGDAPELMALLRDADGVVLGTPNYHGTFSSPLKTVLDYAGSDEFEGTYVGLLTVAGGSFPREALSHLRLSCLKVDATVLNHQAAIPNVYGQFEADPDAPGGRRFADADLRERVEAVGERVARAASRRVPA